MVWRAHIEADDVAHLVDKQWIGGQFEGFRTVRLQAEGAPDALDAGGGNPARSRHSLREAPMSSALRHRLQGCATITASTLVSSIERGTPGRGSSRRPSSRCAMKRARHLHTVCGVTPSFLATTWLGSPAAQASTMRARNAKACAVVRRLAKLRSVSSSASLKAENRQRTTHDPAPQIRS